MPRAVWLTNIPSPYANHRYRLLAEHLGTVGVDFEVLFCAWSESDRHWRWDPAALGFPHRRLWGVQPRIRTRMHTNPGVVTALRRPAPDLLVVAGWSAPTLLIAPYVVPRRTVRLLWSETQAQSEETHHPAVRRAKRTIFERFDGFVVPGDTQARYFADVAPRTANRPVIRLPHIVEETTYHDRVRALRSDAASVAATRAELGVGDDDQLWVSAARLEARKGLHTLLPVLEGVSGVRLAIAGTGSQTEELAELIRRHDLPVTLLGHRQLDDMLRLYAAADLFTLPSLRDPSPVSAVEAAAAGLPLLLSDRAGNFTDVVVEGTSGWGFAPDRPDAMRALVREIAGLSRSELAAMGEASTARYREVFDSERCITSATDALLELIRHPPRR